MHRLITILILAGVVATSAAQSASTSLSSGGVGQAQSGSGPTRPNSDNITAVAPPFDLADIMRMHRAGLEDVVIINELRSRFHPRKLSADDRAMLAKQGVSVEVMAAIEDPLGTNAAIAIQQPSSARASVVESKPTPPPPPAPPAASTPSNDAHVSSVTPGSPSQASSAAQTSPAPAAVAEKSKQKKTKHQTPAAPAQSASPGSQAASTPAAPQPLSTPPPETKPAAKTKGVSTPSAPTETPKSNGSDAPGRTHKPSPGQPAPTHTETAELAVSTKTPTEPGIYQRVAGNGWAAISAESVLWQHSEDNPRKNVVGVVHGSSSSISTAGVAPGILVVTAGNASVFEYQFLRIRPGAAARTLHPAPGGILNSTGSSGDVIGFNAKQIGQNLWLVQLQGLPHGEYALLPPVQSELRSITGFSSTVFTFHL